MELGGGGREGERDGERGWEVSFKIYRFILQFHLNMMMEHEREERLIESVVVIDIDPALALFRPSCTALPMPGRIEMGFESRIAY